jgi:YggT family protein
MKSGPEIAFMRGSGLRPRVLEHPLFGARPAPNLGARFVFQTGVFAMRAILDVILIALDIYVWLLVASAILSWLIAFNVVNTRNQFVSTVAEFLYRITEPALRPIRNMMPNLGGLDISPIILILIIFLIQRVIAYYIYPYVF